MGLAEMVRLLLQHGADASIKCFVSYLSLLCFMPLSMDTNNVPTSNVWLLLYTHILLCLYMQKSEETALFKCKNADTMSVLLEFGAEIDAVDKVHLNVI